MTSPWGGKPDPLVGAIVELPGGDHALVLSIEGEYDDDTTLRYVTGDYAGSLTQRDTFAIRRYPVITKETNDRRS